MSGARRGFHDGVLAILLTAMACLTIVGCEAVLGPKLQPVRSLVAIEVPGEGLARVGPVELESGATIQLRAVLEGKEGKDGEEVVYYTSATRLEINGAEVPASALRPWPEEPISCLWQTLQVSAPFMEINSVERLDKLTFVNFSHPDWGVGCTALATITARQRETLSVPDDAKRLAFGSQNYQVWLQFLAREGDLVAEQSFKSAGSKELLADPDKFPRAKIRLYGSLEKAAAVFGLSQLEPTEELSEEGREQIADLYQRGLIFSRGLLLKDLLEDALDESNWTFIDLEDRPKFAGGTDGEAFRGATDAAAEPEANDGAVRAGDLLRVSERFVVLFRDVGEEGVLDGEDLCFDYERGAIVRRLADVFVGEGDVQWIPRR